jgi:hypothetical protein
MANLSTNLAFQGTPVQREETKKSNWCIDTSSLLMRDLAPSQIIKLAELGAPTNVFDEEQAV